MERLNQRLGELKSMCHLSQVGLGLKAGLIA